jgi:hypothetical protein
MAPTKKDKTKTEKPATEKKSSDDAASKEIIKETKRSTRTPSSKGHQAARSRRKTKGGRSNHRPLLLARS